VGGILSAMLTCKEVSRTIASDELSAASWRQRLAAKLHLLMCRHCRRYAHQIDQIGEAMRESLNDGSPDPESRNRLRSTILESLPPSERSDFDPEV